MNPWIRLYRASLHDPKIVCLSDRVFRAWHNCLLIANDDGLLPSLRDISVHMRCTQTEAEQSINDLVEAQLVDPIVSPGQPIAFRMHDWEKWQRKWDVDRTNAERQKRARRKKKTAGKIDRNGERNGTVTESVTEKRSESVSVSVSSSESKSLPSYPYQERISGLKVENTREGSR